MLEHTRIPIPASAGMPARVDDEYRRCGTANIFLCVEPLTGRTIIKATERRAKIDFAHFVRDLCDGPFHEAEKLVVVMDNLNIIVSGATGTGKSWFSCATDFTQYWRPDALVVEIGFA